MDRQLSTSPRIVAADTFAPFEVYALLLAAYVTLTYLVSLSAGALHRRLNRGRALGAN